MISLRAPVHCVVFPLLWDIMGIFAISILYVQADYYSEGIKQSMDQNFDENR